ncbi:hypothetical protein [Argonema antarcticum]|uniref:hypothetical protein n=1 Tax=Argonema antarcticum TaxID=2942763 RepID=UPI002013B6AD|nr:hypothetical protein [Argonema antarcticum]MCL1475635.1 hypothetical protein [Argonema antarcticum A004/B2]
MAGKAIDKSASGALILIIPIALAIVILFKAWPVLLALVSLGGTLSIWQRYQWQKWSQQLNPFFNQLIEENRGCLTVLDLSMKAKISGTAAKRYLDAKAEEFGAQGRDFEDKGRVYYFITAKTLGNIFDDDTPSFQLESKPYTVEAFEPLSLPPEAIEKPTESPTEAEKAPEPLTSEEPPEALTSEEPVTSEETPEPLTSKKPVTSEETPEPVTSEKPPEALTFEKPVTSEEPPEALTFEKPVTSEEPPEALTFEEPPEPLIFEKPPEPLIEEEPPEPLTSEELAKPLPKKHRILQSLIQSELARRLDVHSSTVLKRRDDSDFPQWSRSRDPEGIAWEYSPDTREFYPIE